ncbi:MAG: hypothetical protein Q8L14_14225 [Myxococcales bacterium]|nr:hypothetical protein [Myxococcales bacterium]
MLSVSVLALLLGQEPGSWSCQGQAPLPPGEAVEFEVGFAANGASQNLVEQAKLEGISQLNRKLCPQFGEDCLRTLRSEISSGASGSNEKGACTVVYIERSRLMRWKAARAVTEFEEQLLPKVRSLLEKAGHTSAQSLVVKVSSVEDMPGAPVARSRWMKDQLEKALTGAGAKLGSDTTPNKLEGRMYGRSKEERLDLSIDLSTADGRFSESLAFSPLAAGADAPVTVALGQSGLRGRVALLPLDLNSSNWTIDQVTSFNLLIKQESGAQLNGIGYAVEPVTISMRGRCDDRCASDAARAIGATHFITGSVTVDEGSSTVYLFLRDVTSLAQRGELRLEGTTTRDLRRDFAAKASPFFARMVGDVKAADSIPVPRALSWVALGTGIAAVGVGVVLRVLAQLAVSGNLQGLEMASMLKTNSLTEKQAAAAVTLGAISNVLFISGGLVAAGGVVGLFLTPTTNGAVAGIGGTLP